MSRFDDVFHPENKWKNIKLTDMCPCDECNTYKDYEFESTIGNIAERQYAELPESCRCCIHKIKWEIDCMNKLIWYENRDETLKSL